MAAFINKAKAMAAKDMPESTDVIFAAGETTLTATHLRHPDGKVSLIDITEVKAKRTCCGLRSSCEITHTDKEAPSPLKVVGPNALELHAKIEEMKAKFGV